jgi:hypothetical protein
MLRFLSAGAAPACAAAPFYAAILLFSPNPAFVLSPFHV